jgi:hypothetical protein
MFNQPPEHFRKAVEISNHLPDISGRRLELLPNLLKFWGGRLKVSTNPLNI